MLDRGIRCDRLAAISSWDFPFASNEMFDRLSGPGLQYPGILRRQEAFGQTLIHDERRRGQRDGDGQRQPGTPKRPAQTARIEVDGSADNSSGR